MTEKLQDCETQEEAEKLWKERHVCGNCALQSVCKVAIACAEVPALPIVSDCALHTPLDDL